MRQLLLPATAVALVIALALLFFLGESAPRTSLDESAEHASQVRQDLSDPQLAAPPATLSADTEPHSSQSERVVFEPAAQVAAVPMARVFGRIVDSLDQPVAGLRVELTSVDGAWRDGTEVPEITRGRWTSPGWRTSTDAAGRFEFEVPVPTSEWVSLYANSDPMLGILGRNFGPAGGRNEPRIFEGDNDLGNFVAPLAGALEGLVTDAAGQPIEGVDVRLDGSYPGGYGVVATTGEDGRYHIGHLQAGPAWIEAQGRGYLNQRIEAPQLVRVRETLPGPDFVLERAPSISGVVVDESGVELEGIWIYGWPVGSGSGAGAWSGADGRFVIHIPQNESYRLEVDRDPRFRRWGGHETRGSTFAPGTDDVRIVLERVASMTFAVVDASTGAAVERFSIFAGEVGGYQVEHLLERGEFSGGRVELHAAPAPQQRVFVRAPGYVPFEADIEYDVAEVALQTIRLEVGARISGRVMYAEQPLQSALVTITPRRMPKNPDVPVDPDDWWGDSWVYDAAAGADHHRVISTDATGRFDVSDLSKGSYRLEVASEFTAPQVVEPIELEARGARELGDIALGGGATLQCTVRLPGAESAVGLRFESSAGYRTDGEIESSDGRFSVTGLPPGEHEILLWADGRRVLEDVMRKFQVGAGGTHEMLIDLSASLPTRVSVHLLCKGQTVAGVEVQLDVVDSNGLLIEDATSTKLGLTDAEGVAAGRVPSGRFVRVTASDLDRTLGLGEPFELLPGEQQRAELELEIGTLRLAFPDGFELPKRAKFHLIFRKTVSPGQRERRWMQVSGSRGDDWISRFDLAWDSKDVRIGYLQAGHYEMQLSAWEVLEDGMNRRALLEDFAGEFDIEAGEATTIEITPQ